MSNYRIAQLNIARMKAPLESALMSDFVANLDRINQLAEASRGFVWRLKDDNNNAVAFRPFGADVIVNMSVWADLASLSDYAFRSGHVDIMRRRREWFHSMAEAHAVLWWVHHEHRPSIDEANERLQHLRTHGATPHAFTFKQSFAAPDAAGSVQAVDSHEALR